MASVALISQKLVVVKNIIIELYSKEMSTVIRDSSYNSDDDSRSQCLKGTRDDFSQQLVHKTQVQTSPFFHRLQFSAVVTPCVFVMFFWRNIDD